MTADEFWEIVDRIHEQSQGDMETKCELLKENLSTLDKDSLLAFSRHFDSFDHKAYTWELWGAAYVINGGCSDDGFMDFRSTLISYGNEVYSQALKDPESLAELKVNDPEELFYEGFNYELTDALENLFDEIPVKESPLPDEPTGNEWDEDGVEKLYPQLAAKYGSDFDTGDDDPPPKKPWWKFWA